MHYSPLCDTSIVAYLAYIAASGSEQYGASTVRPLRVVGRGGVNARGGGGNCHGGDVVAVFSGLLTEAQRGSLDVGAGATSGGVRDYVDDLFGARSWRGQGSTVGLAVGDARGGVGRLDSGDGPEHGRDASRAPVRPEGSGQQLVSDAVGGATTAFNRAKREKRKRAKLRKQGAAAGVVEECVPEWRQKQPSAALHKGAFRECSEKVQSELRESRAEMLVAQNRMAVVKAEHDRRTLEARLKCRLVEEQVECKRLESAKEYEKLAAEHNKKYPVGYAETVASLGESLPSLNSSGISPDSSISVAELKRREEAFVKQAAELQACREQLRQFNLERAKEKKKTTYAGVVGLKKSGLTCNGSVSAFENSVDGVFTAEEQYRRKLMGLPITGPGSGVGGFGRWD